VKTARKNQAKRGSLQIDAIVALALLSAVVLPMGFGFVGNQRMLRHTHHRAVAMELIDGELEVLASGDWRAVPVGTREVRMTGRAAANLPPGRFVLTRSDKNCRIEWIPVDTRNDVRFAREIPVTGGSR
jgi:hypothetical protein